MLIPVLFECSGSQIGRDNEIVFPFVGRDSIANVLTVYHNSFEALVLRCSLHQVEDHWIWKSNVNLKHLGSLTFGGLHNFFNTEGALTRQNEKLIHFGCCLS